MASPHVTDVDIERFHRRQLAGDVLVAFADHLAACGDCRARVTEQSDVAAASASLYEGLGVGDDDHATESEILAFVDGGLEAERRDEISTHLAGCRSCAEEVRDLQAFAAERGRPAAFRPPWRYRILAAAAVLVLGVAVAFTWRAQHPRLAATIIGVDDIAALPPADAARVRDALESGRLSLPSTLSELTGRQGVLMGAADAPAFHLAAPVATAVLGTSPQLQWTALAGATTYVVTLQDQSTGETINSPALARTDWTPDRPLIRGRTYTWQVAGSTGAKESLAPRPPEPPARFMVVDASDARRLADLPPSPLVRGVLYAHAGLLDEAEREIKSIAPDGRGFDRVDAFLDQLHRARSPVSGAPSARRPRE